MTLSPDREAKYTQWLAEIEQGATVRQALDAVGWHWRSAQLAITHDEDTIARYALARRQSALFWADKAVHASERATDKESAAVARVQSEVYKWRAKVANPKEYGDRVDVQADVRHTVTGVIALPAEEPPPLPRFPHAEPVTVVDATTPHPQLATPPGGGGQGGPEGVVPEHAPGDALLSPCDNISE